VFLILPTFNTLKFWSSLVAPFALASHAQLTGPSPTKPTEPYLAAEPYQWRRHGATGPAFSHISSLSRRRRLGCRWRGRRKSFEGGAGSICLPISCLASHWPSSPARSSSPMPPRSSRSPPSRTRPSPISCSMGRSRQMETGMENWRQRERKRWVAGGGKLDSCRARQRCCCFGRETLGWGGGHQRQRQSKEQQ
jgi:hypothetical protein